ncbi:MAG: acyltransferase [Actinobacteria bacterium]|nr:acyltransferase [Actinomycetota bacterium]
MFVALPSDPGDTRRRFPYVASLDGIRGLLVFPVLLFHFTVSPGDGLDILASGSFIAPSMFFTLSGFLITSLLLVEKEKKDRIDWVGFWRRRFRRLLPGSVAVILFVALVAVVRPQTWNLRPTEALAGLLSFKNWQDISYAGSETDGLRTLGPLSPFWSLSIEEQFYLGMSVVIGLAMLTKRWKLWMASAFVVLALYSAVSMALIDSTLNREFFGTDTRAAELVCGCLLALAVAEWGWPRSRWWGAVGWVSLALTVYGWATFTEHDGWILNGGLSAWALVNCGLVLGSSAMGSSFAKAFSFRPLVEIGKLSYPIYLCHWPVSLAIRPGTLQLDGTGLLLTRIVVSIIVAVPLAYAVEAPIRSGRVLRGWAGPAAWAACVIVIVGLTRAAN